MSDNDKMKAQEYIDKTRAYLDYLEEHIENVRLAFDSLSRICESMWWVKDCMIWHQLRQDVFLHDVSKFSAEEFTQYRQSFYPIEGEGKNRVAFNNAWDHHKNDNHHHHESVSNLSAVVHMIVDWTAMGYKFGDTAQSYYENNKAGIELTEDQIEFMYEIFKKIADA